MNNIINEQYNPYDQSMEVTCDFDGYYNKLTYNGREIADIAKSTFVVTYDVEPEYRRYGIKSIYVTGIKGPEEIEVEIATDKKPEERNEDDFDDYIEDYLTLKLDWGNMLNVYENEMLGYFGVAPDASITLESDDAGGLRVKSINIEARNF